MFAKFFPFPAPVYLYFLCQSIGLTVAVTSVTISAVVGVIIAPSPAWATVPYGVQFLAILLSSYPIALVMARYGRRVGFYGGVGALIVSGIVGFYAVERHDFVMLIIAYVFLGLFLGTANYFRYAVTDDLPDNAKSGALSLVVAGGIVGPLLSAPIANALKDSAGFESYALCYLVLVGFAVVLAVLLAYIPFAPHRAEKMPQSNSIPLRNTVSDTQRHMVFLGMITAGVGYCLMTLTMVQSSLHMMHLNIHFEPMAYAIQWHAIAMFAPSFFTGKIIAQYGHRPIMLAGVILYAITFIINMVGQGYTAIAVGLILLGLAWNFTYVAGSALLTTNAGDKHSTKRWQGTGETVVAILSTIGAFAPAVLFAWVGWHVTNAMLLCMTVGLFIYMAYSLIKIKHNTN